MTQPQNEPAEVSTSQPTPTHHTYPQGGQPTGRKWLDWEPKPRRWGGWRLNLWRRYLSYRINLAAARRNSATCESWVPEPAGFTAGPEETTVLCPKCGSDYSHIINVFTRLGSDSYEAKVYRRTKAVGTVTVGARRSCLVVVFEVECGHAFEWPIQQHKGNNFVTAEFVRNSE